MLTNGLYEHAPDWYRNFRYEEEIARGLDGIEDLASPGTFRFDLLGSDAELVFATAVDGVTPFASGSDAGDYARSLRESEATRRAAFPSRLHRAADAYLVSRGRGQTIVAGYPWFTDWGRDTFIALRGICLAADRVDDARRILLEWTTAISEGMLPNRFPDQGEAPEFNSVDASLWFVVAVYDLFDTAARCGVTIGARDRAALETAVDDDPRRLRRGHALRHPARLRRPARRRPAGGPAHVDGREGRRLGRDPANRQAGGSRGAVAERAVARRASATAAGSTCSSAAVNRSARGSGTTPPAALNDVVDVNHERGTFDATFRPNQVLALGGLPLALVDGARARRAVEAVEQRLWTPVGLRSLAPGEPGYIGRYAGGVLARDGAYHQGTVWPWLLTPFVEAWVRARGGRPDARQEARTRFLAPLLRHLDEAGLDHVSEIADGDAPHRPNGCPFQAWSVGEALRLDRVVLAEPGF